MLLGNEYLTFAELRKRLGISKNELHGLIERGLLTPAISYRGRAHIWRGDALDTAIDSDVDLPFVFLEWPKQRGPHRYSFEYGGEAYPPAGNVAEALKLRFTGDDINQEYVEMHGCFFMHLVEHVEWLRRLDDLASKAKATGTKKQTITHKVETRSNDLTAVIALAQKTAIDPNDTSSVWAELVRLSELNSEERPPPLIGVENGEIRYTASNGEVKFFNREALRKRIKNAANRR